LRKFAAALLAVPVLAVIYVPVLLRRSIAARVGITIVVGALIGVGVLGLVTPARTVATAPRDPIVPLTNAAFGTAIETDAALNHPITIAFSAPMNATSVAGLVRVEPATDVVLTWDAAGSNLTVTPKAGWGPSTYHTVSVLPGALAQNGRPTSVPARVAFLTRAGTTGAIAATGLAGTVAAATTAIRLTFDHRVDLAAVQAGLHIEPALPGILASTDQSAGGSAFTFTPGAPLVAGTAYTISLVGVVDAEGGSIGALAPLTITTAAPPKIVRFRPADGAKGVDRAAILSVRFSEPMDRSTTKAALTVISAGKAVAGRISFAEKDTVLVFRPTAPLAFGALIEMRVGAGATSIHSVPLASAATVRMAVVAKPQPAVARAAPRPKPPTGGSGGGAVGGGSWGAAETYYLGLMNCTRTGGWVTSSGACSSPGGRAVGPLRLDAGISTKVSRPYAKLLATRGICSHFIDGNPGNRLSRAGYRSYVWAENLACQSFGVMTVMRNAQIFFQNEKSTNGGHYVNMMNAKYDRCGIGVWVVSGRVRLVIDFYHP
jgi:uncharacterized protein YkwD